MKLKIENISIDKLKKYENNTRIHNDYDVSQIAKSIEKYGFNDPIGVWGDNIIVEGHGRLEAAKMLGMSDVPVIRLDHLTDEQRKEYGIMHNKTAELSKWDFDLLANEIAELDLSDFDVDFGIDIDDITDSIDTDISETDNTYTAKTDTIQYEMTGEKPAVSDLYDKEKYDKLIAEIKNADIDEKDKNFLLLSASRFIVFNFKKIAEYYAHCEKNVQGLMEKLALVIIDYDDAIKNGFVNIRNEISDMFEEEWGEEDE